eukprot:CAMPEP_0194254838 /NCGR_PEP_ID=MMETSP0158-20130606/33007_1 /TAXON_ID=33649 /ORGANISM="Thalassionema nitzschioides, Strain L26-B" /LENGTH=46 /DNA_ID= /DNA_START= /DNA_END= /DNA_ORIENTATION=
MNRTDKTNMIHDIVDDLYSEGTCFFRRAGVREWALLNKKEAKLVVG